VLSVIIPAYNEERLIGRSLSALTEGLRSVQEPYEVLVVDDASVDRTGAIAREHGARVVKVSHRQIAATRNAGAREARGDLFVFIDADTRAGGAVLRAAIAAMRGGAVGGGSRVRFDEPLPTYARLVHPLLLATMRTARLAAGCFLFCTREAFYAVGGFDEKMYGAEEIAMSQALKRQGRFVLLPEQVETSGRKLRAYSGMEILQVVAQLASRGSKSVESRQGLDMWYGPRREDPEAERLASSG
jgi:glycosyltransferase involved in cell wall biosynthesis